MRLKGCWQAVGMQLAFGIQAIQGLCSAKACAQHSNQPFSKANAVSRLMLACALTAWPGWWLTRWHARCAFTWAHMA